MARAAEATVSSWRAPLAWLPWVVALGLAAFLLFGPSGWRELARLRAERAKLEARVAELEADNAELRARIERLERSQAALERLARERLGVVRQDEWIVPVAPARR